MPSKYPVCTSKEAIGVLREFGFSDISQRGSHLKLSDGRRVVIVPMHSEIAKGTLKSILAQANIDIEDFKRKL